MLQINQRSQNKTSELEAVVTKACSAQEAPASICTDANNNLAQAKTDLTNATALLKSNPTDLSGVQKLIMDAAQHLNKVADDLNSLATSTRVDQALAYIKDTLQPRIAKDKAEVQKANLSSSLTQQLLGQLAQAQSLLDNATKTLPTDWNKGTQEVQQAVGIMTRLEQQLASSIQLQTALSHIQDIQKRLAQDEKAAQNANLPSAIAQQVQQQLTQAKSLLDGAIQSLQKGDMNSALQQVQRPCTSLTR
jgi:hypothetical protein